MKITLCGSTWFAEAFKEANKRLTLAGHVVYSVAYMVHTDPEPPTEEQKVMLDLVHLVKIDNSDCIFVLDVDDYVGFSTKRAIAWAKMKNKPIMYLSKYDPDNFDEKTYLEGVGELEDLKRSK